MPKSYFALITPFVGGGGRPDQGLPGEQPGIDNSLPGGGGGQPDQGLPPFPAHPIIIPPDFIEPGVPSHPIFIPPQIDNSLPPFAQPPIYIPPDAIGPGVPSHPIYIPIYPDQGLPGSQPHPDQGLPGSQPHPDQGLPGQGAGGGGGGERPDNSLPPIELPPLPEIPEDAQGLVLVKMRGEEAEWRVIDSNGELLPPEGEAGSGAQPKKGGRSSRK